jgi:nicotinate-nucleotide pyrophosphorylase (carboxylating)
MTIPSHRQKVSNSVKKALKEDIGSGDITAQIIPEDNQCKANLIVRNKSILCGLDWFNKSFSLLNKDVEINWHKEEGTQINQNDHIATLKGSSKGILTGERTALNFLQFMSGIAFKTSLYRNKLVNSKAVILDTRKTIPNLRYEQKYAVKCGGGKNHRMGLYDAILIKENHIQAAGSISKAIKAFKKTYNKRIEVEVQNLLELEEAISSKADIVLLDNFSLENLEKAVVINNKKVLLEVSGNVDLESIKKLADTDIDYISTGDLTKNIQAADFSLLIQ